MKKKSIPIDAITELSYEDMNGSICKKIDIKNIIFDNKIQGIQFYRVSKKQYEADLIANNYDPKDCLTISKIPLPVRATKGSAGYDFISPVDIKFSIKNPLHKKGKGIYYLDRSSVIAIIPTGIRCKMPEGFVLTEVPRSGIGFKYGVSFLNTIGIIDSDYFNAKNEGHIMLALRFEGGMNKEKEFVIKKGERICQGIFIRHYITESDNITTIRSGGIGSTGK